MKVNDICPFCNKGILVFIPEDEPWNIDHLQCEKCDSTYILNEDAEDARKI